MIEFDNVELTNIAPVKIEDINVSPIKLNPVSRQRAIQFGADFVRMGGGTRNVTVTFALLDSDFANRENKMQAIRDWAQIGKQCVLKLPQYTDRHLVCAVTGLPDYSYRKWWEGRLSLIFTCYDNPFWTANEATVVSCGDEFTVEGSAPPLVSVDFYNATILDETSYSDGTNTMTFTQIPAGATVIDFNRQIASVDDVSIMPYYVPTSEWIVPKVGAEQIITGEGDLKIYERWV